MRMTTRDDAVSRQAVLDLTASEITRRAIKDLQAVPSLDVEAAVRRALEKAAEIAGAHYSRVQPHYPDIPMGDLVAQGYGNASLNIGHSIRALMEPAEMAYIMDAKP